MIYYLNLFGTAVFAIGGGLAASRKGMDLFGVAVAAVLTGIGGGTLRDLCLGVQPVNWVTDPTALEVATIFGLLTFAYVRFRQFAGIPNGLLVVADAVGLAVFTVLGCNTALTYNAGAVIAVIMGMVTGSGGGIIRDVFSAEIPLFLSQGDICYCEPCWWRRVSSLAGFRPRRNLGDVGGSGCNTDNTLGSHLLGIVSAGIEPRGGRSQRLIE